MTSVYVTSPSGACHNYLDMEVAAVDTHARVRHGHVSYIHYNRTELYDEVSKRILVNFNFALSWHRITSLHDSHFGALRRWFFQ